MSDQQPDIDPTFLESFHELMKPYWLAVDVLMDLMKTLMVEFTDVINSDKFQNAVQVLAEIAEQYNAANEDES